MDAGQERRSMSVEKKDGQPPVNKRHRRSRSRSRDRDRDYHRDNKRYRDRDGDRRRGYRDRRSRSRSRDRQRSNYRDESRRQMGGRYRGRDRDRSRRKVIPTRKPRRERKPSNFDVYPPGVTAENAAEYATQAILQHNMQALQGAVGPASFGGAPPLVGFYKF